jgi:transcriptional regulator with GAF, ATPase, and Fis domain
MQEIFERIGHLASLEKEPPTVLLTGETGTGKSLFARALHMQSQRARRPFMEIGCTSLPPTLVETELFGYEKGSFTDARDSRIGLIEAAEGGTVLLDEVGDLDLSLQGKLLRAIDERTIRRIGSVRDRKVDAWILAATNKDLEAAVAQGAFRNDLYYRLAVVTLHLPPLRDRAADVAPLAAFFLKRFAAKYGKRISRLSEETVSVLGQYRWPGNIRELKHVIERAVLASRNETIGLEDITLGPADPSRSPSPSPDASLPPSQFPPEGIPLVQMERAMIERALKEAKGNQAKAARLLGLSRDTLRYRMAKFKIAP